MTRHIETANFYAEKNGNGRSTWWTIYQKNGNVSKGMVSTKDRANQVMQELEAREAKLNANKETTVTLTAQELVLLNEALSRALFSMKEEEIDENKDAYITVDKKLRDAFEAIK